MAPHQSTLHRRVGEILHYIWDPIGVSAIPEARDEYDSYVSSVFSHLVNQSSEGEIAEYLLMIEGERMGLSITQKARDRATEVAGILMNHKDVIWERAGFSGINEEAEQGGDGDAEEAV